METVETFWTAIGIVELITEGSLLETRIIANDWGQSAVGLDALDCRKQEEGGSVGQGV